MGTILQQLPEGARVAIVRLRSLGDCVLTTPAISVLKRSRPDLRLAVVVEERFRPVFEGNPGIESLLGPSARELAGWRPELCLNLHGGTRSLALTCRAGARFRAGFAHHRYSFLYNVRIPTAQEILGVTRKVHTAEHLASAMFYLGADRCEIPRASLYSAPAPAGSYAVLHPFASGPDKTWPAASFLALAGQLKVEPVFIAGPDDDVSAFAAHRVVCAPLGEVKSLLSGAALFIGNDSGPAHMAAAFGVPSLVIFGASDVDVWSPWKTEAQILHLPTVPEAMAALARLKVAA